MPYTSENKAAARHGRAAGFNPPNPYEPLHHEEDPGTLEPAELRQIPTRFIPDSSRTILARNQSPDINFNFSLNPYRGCEHGCIYCYARPSHEHLGFSAGLDFETRIIVKEKAPELLATAFRKASWRPQTVALSGNTDPYQPIERKLRLTRACLEVFDSFQNPLVVITKNHLVCRDADILTRLARNRLVRVAISITSLQPEIISRMEPRTSRPDARLNTIRELSDKGIPVSVMVAPVIPGLTDEEVPEIIRQAAEAGAVGANYILLRLPGAVKPLFLDWISRHFPTRHARVVRRLRSLRGPTLTDGRFSLRQHGEGHWAHVLSQLVTLTKRRLGLDAEPAPLDSSRFRRHEGFQATLFSPD